MMDRFHREEQGAVAIVTALLLIVLVLLAAFLVDLGATRADARTDQLLADTAVMAAANHNGSAVEQCQQAVRYLAANVSDGSFDDSPCSMLPTTCNSSTAPVRTDPPIEVGPYAVVVTHPVANDDPSMIVEGQVVDPGPAGRDGTPCHRIKVEVRRARDFTFGPAGGGQGQGASYNDAVAIRNVEDDPEEFATLVLLEQQECQELTVGGGGGVVIQNAYDGAGNLEAGGIVHLDSDGLDPGNSCNGNNRIVDPGSSSNSVICSGVDGRDPVPLTPENEFLIELFSTHRCEPLAYSRTVLPNSMRVKGSTNVALPKYLAGGANDHQLEADPLTVDFRITRSIVDHEYNCLHDPNPGDGVTTYPTNEPQYPSAGLVEPIPFCTDPNRSPHIDELIAATFTGGAPPGFVTVGCTPPDPVDDQFVYVDCNQMPGVSFQSDVIVLEGGPGNPDGINGGTISVEPHATSGIDSTILVIKDGNIAMSTGDSLTLDRTFVYLHDGNMTINGGENLTWHGPTAVGYDDSGSVNCAPLAVPGGGTVPHPSCFENLSLWTNTTGNPTGKHSMAGNGEIDVRGVFFGPKADFDLSGSGNTAGAPLRMEQAQFFTRTLDISGGNGVAMLPDPNTFLETPPPAISLIR